MCVCVSVCVCVCMCQFEKFRLSDTGALSIPDSRLCDYQTKMVKLPPTKHRLTLSTLFEVIST